MWFHCTKFLRGDELTLAYAVILSSAVVSQVSLPSSTSAAPWHEMCSSQTRCRSCSTIKLTTHDLSAFWLHQQLDVRHLHRSFPVVGIHGLGWWL